MNHKNDRHKGQHPDVDGAMTEAESPVAPYYDKIRALREELVSKDLELRQAKAERDVLKSRYNALLKEHEALLQKLEVYEASEELQRLREQHAMLQGEVDGWTMGYLTGGVNDGMW